MTEIKKLTIKGEVNNENQQKVNHQSAPQQVNFEEVLANFKSELLIEIDKKIAKAIEKNNKR